MISIGMNTAGALCLASAILGGVTMFTVDNSRVEKYKNSVKVVEKVLKVDTNTAKAIVSDEKAISAAAQIVYVDKLVPIIEKEIEYVKVPTASNYSATLSYDSLYRYDSLLRPDRVDPTFRGNGASSGVEVAYAFDKVILPNNAKLAKCEVSLATLQNYINDYNAAVKKNTPPKT